MKLQILLLMAGSSQSFQDAGFTFPKNLIEINDRPLAEQVITSLFEGEEIENKLICVIRRDENQRFHTGQVIHLVRPDAEIIEVRGNTSGAACTALLAIDSLVPEAPLIILNGDQVIDGGIWKAIASFQERSADGGTIVFDAVHPRWSFVRTNEKGWVVEAAEKRPISRMATAGAYYFKRAELFLKGATEMIKKDAHVNGLFFVCPIFNELILQQLNIATYRIARESYHSLATPAGVEEYTSYLREKKHHYAA